MTTFECFIGTLVIIQGVWLNGIFRERERAVDPSQRFEKGLEIGVYVLVFIFIDLVLVLAATGEHP